MPYAVLIPTKAISDFETLRTKANALATRYSSGQQLWWWAERSDEIVFCFENGAAAVVFTMYCANHGIRFRAEWPKN
jgi:hypothetical protein